MQGAPSARDFVAEGLFKLAEGLFTIMCQYTLYRRNALKMPQATLTLGSKCLASV